MFDSGSSYSFHGLRHERKIINTYHFFVQVIRAIWPSKESEQETSLSKKEKGCAD